MNLENQVTNLELSKKLEQLGVRQESLFYWHRAIARNVDWAVTLGRGYTSEAPADGENFSAFTVAELFDLIPGNTGTKRVGLYFKLQKGMLGNLYYAQALDMQTNIERFAQSSETATDALAKMLIYLLENNLIQSNGN